MKLQRTLLLSALAVAFVAAAYAQTSSNDLPDAPAATAAAMTHPNGPIVVMDTSMGRITCQFFQRQAPKAVANFISLAEGTKDWTDPATGKKQHNKPLYYGTIFHRVIPGFMIQGGDPTGTGMGDPGYQFEDEIDPNLNFDVPGRLAMANSGPNTNGSQFFITDAPTPWLNGHHTIFGQCDAAGILVERAIVNVPRDSNDKPLTPVVIKNVTILRVEGQPLPPDPNATPQPATELPKHINVSGGVMVGMLAHKTQPEYPVNARQAGISGTVVLEAVIGVDGKIQDLKVISGPEQLQQAALDSVRSWRYRPFLLQGKPIEVHTTINVIFSLGN
jgi:peptidyl-prolyl cis-trans isomerase A (cyclophilin A)